MTTVYITNRALSQGIRAMTTTSDTTQNVIRAYRGEYSCGHFRKPDWHLSRVDALARAESMRLKKIADLRKWVSELEDLEFT